MNTIKTKIGTELPLTDINGKPYLTVPYRVMWFRKEHPTGRITTTIIRTDDKQTTAYASIEVHNDKYGYIQLANAHKTEHAAHFVDHLEKAETSAIGRALALCGYGTAMALELEEGSRIVDAPIARTETFIPSGEVPTVSFSMVENDGHKAIFSVSKTSEKSKSTKLSKEEYDRFMSLSGDDAEFPWGDLKGTRISLLSDKKIASTQKWLEEFKDLSPLQKHVKRELEDRINAVNSSKVTNGFYADKEDQIPF